MKKDNKQKGAVSLFVVIFAALLITVVTVSFVRIMVQNQKQASARDLSQSAYDSAQAGVEDAKRALLRYQDICNTGTDEDCSAIKTQVIGPWASECNTAVKSLSDVTDSGDEIQVQNGGNSNALDQAYTCVKINTQTDDYIGELGQDASKVIPLVGESNFDSIKVEWFSSRDLQGSGTAVNVPSFTDGVPLLNQNSWTSTSRQNRPSLMRAQLVELNTAGFVLTDFNSNTSANGSSNTLFLYPSNIADTSKNFSSNVRLTPATPNASGQINCKDDLSAGGYACSATLILPRAVDANHKAYLILKSFYKSTSYRVTLLGGGSLVRFNGVQPSIDSTGRANDLFRRVQARVEMIDTSFPYPQAEIDINGNLCKDFMITNNPDDYWINPACTP
jgi:Tfp pilus assembly protein PilX